MSNSKKNSYFSKNRQATAGDYLNQVLPKNLDWGQEHQYKFNIIVGSPGTGKSTLLLNQFIIKSKLPVLVFATKAQKWQESLPCVESSDLRYWDLVLDQARKKGSVPVLRGFDNGGSPENFMDNLIYLADEKRLNALLVLEDCTNYVQHKASQRFQRICNQREHFKCHVIMTYHSLESVPRELMQYADNLILFKTYSSDKHLKGLAKIPNATKVLDAFRTVEASPNKHDFIIVEMQKQ